MRIEVGFSEGVGKNDDSVSCGCFQIWATSVAQK